MGLVNEEHVLIADNPDAFAAAVQRLYSDRDLWQRLREGGRAHAISHFGIDRMRKGVSEMLEGMPATASVAVRSALSTAP